jgi:hypothetical protein
MAVSADLVSLIPEHVAEEEDEEAMLRQLQAEMAS